MNRFAEFLDAYAEQLARLAAELDALHRDLSELRNEMRSSLTHDEPEPELQEAA
jgi:hypothetical protein